MHESSTVVPAHDQSIVTAAELAVCDIRAIKWQKVYSV